MPAKPLILGTSFALAATSALGQTTQDEVVQMLMDAGFVEIEISRTLFGNLKIEAEAEGVERVLILGRDGTILRDRTEFDDDEDEEFDDEEDDEEFDDEEDDEEFDDEDDKEDDDEDGEDDDGEDDEEA